MVVVVAFAVEDLAIVGTVVLLTVVVVAASTAIWLNRHLPVKQAVSKCQGRWNDMFAQYHFATYQLP